jgi:hypothetical protein
MAARPRTLARIAAFGAIAVTAAFINVASAAAAGQPVAATPEDTGLTAAGMAVIAIALLSAGIGATLHARRVRFLESRATRIRSIRAARARVRV